MKEPAGNTKCRRCGATYVLHHGEGVARRCPWKAGGTFRRNTPHKGAAQSFTEHEVMVLDQVTRALLRGGDLRGLAEGHTDTLESLARKAAGMRRTAAPRKAGV